jgi:catechol 2,3-dioxygenase-like lactoylglutathione lyase family enzyme
MIKGWTFEHIAIVVKDLEKAIKHYQSLGATLIDGPTDLAPDPKIFKIHGQTPQKIKFRACHMILGGLKIEFHQPLEGETPWQEFLDKFGEGVDHVGYYVDDVKKEAAKMEEKGFPIVKSTIEPGDKWVAVYLDTRQIGNVKVELSNKALIDAHQAILDEEDKRKGVKARNP